MYFIKLSNLFLLLGSTAWFAKSFDWEPFIAFVSFLTTFLVQDVNDYKKATSNNEEYDQDKELFNDYENILSGDELLYVLDNKLGNLRTDGTFTKKLGKFLLKSDRIEGAFNNKKVQKKFSNFVTKLKYLQDFIAGHFFVPKEGMWKNSEDEFLFYLYPDLKNSGDPEKRNIYVKRERELYTLIDETIDAYKEYRKYIKKIMNI